MLVLAVHGTIKLRWRRLKRLERYAFTACRLQYCRKPRITKYEVRTRDIFSHFGKLLLRKVHILL